MVFVCEASMRRSWRRRGAFQLLSWVLRRQPGIATLGGPHVYSSHTGLACPRLVLPRFQPAHLSARAAAGRRCHSHHRTTHRLQPAAHPRTPRPRRSLQLPPRLVPGSLVRPATGRRADPLPLASLLARWHRHACRRRHRHRAPRTPGLRQGASPRRRAFQPLLYGLALGAQVGRPGCPGPLPLHPTTLGVARAGGPVSLAGGQRQARAAPQDPGPGHAGAAASAVALVVTVTCTVAVFVNEKFAAVATPLTVAATM